MTNNSSTSSPLINLSLLYLRMDFLKIEGTDTTPTITCNGKENTVEVLGRSIPENASEFYAPFVDWLENYKDSDKEKLHLTFFLDYINSISYKMIFEVLLITQKMVENGKSISVLWKYEEGDEEILEEGKIFAAKINLSFEFEEVPEDL